jgi:hypothetical protein
MTTRETLMATRAAFLPDHNGSVFEVASGELPATREFRLIRFARGDLAGVNRFCRAVPVSH